LSFRRYPDLQLFSTVFHVWGKLNRTFDRSAQGENLLDYFDQYVKWTDPSRPNFLQVGVLACSKWIFGVPLYRLAFSSLAGGACCSTVGKARTNHAQSAVDEGVQSTHIASLLLSASTAVSVQVFMDSPGLVNGFYNVWIEGSLATSYPDLVSLFGLDQYDDGSAKYMGVSLRNSSNRPVPIQTVRSKIADLAGPDVPVPIGGAATFTWETQGYGEQFCYVDGQKVANTADLVSARAL
jgi:hypothetical protein